MIGLRDARLPSMNTKLISCFRAPRKPLMKGFGEFFGEKNREANGADICAEFRDILCLSPHAE